MTDDTTADDSIDVQAVDDAGESDDDSNAKSRETRDHKTGSETRNALMKELNDADAGVVVTAKDCGDHVEVSVGNFMLDGFDDHDEIALAASLDEALREFMPDENEPPVGVAAIDADHLPPELRELFESMMGDGDPFSGRDPEGSGGEDGGAR